MQYWNTLHTYTADNIFSMHRLGSGRISPPYTLTKSKQKKGSFVSFLRKVVSMYSDLYFSSNVLLMLIQL